MSTKSSDTGPSSGNRDKGYRSGNTVTTTNTEEPRTDISAYYQYLRMDNQNMKVKLAKVETELEVTKARVAELKAEAREAAQKAEAREAKIKAEAEKRVAEAKAEAKEAVKEATEKAEKREADAEARGIATRAEAKEEIAQAYARADKNMKLFTDALQSKKSV